MRDQIRSEMRKIRSTRSAWGLLAAAIALAGLAAWAMVASMHFGPAVALTTLPGFAEMMILVPILTAVLGIRSYTDEARHGSIVPTLLASPKRRRVVASKVVVLAGAATVFAVAASLTVAVVSGALLVADGVVVSVSVAALAVLLAKAIAICALWAAIGLGIGVTVSHQVAAIVGTILWLLVGEGIVEMLSAPVARFLPAHASTSVLGIAAADASLVAPLVGGGLLIGWTALSVGLGPASWSVETSREGQRESLKVTSTDSSGLRSSWRADRHSARRSALVGSPARERGQRRRSAPGSAPRRGARSARPGRSSRAGRSRPRNSRTCSLRRRSGRRRSGRPGRAAASSRAPQGRAGRDRSPADVARVSNRYASKKTATLRASEATKPIAVPAGPAAA